MQYNLANKTISIFFMLIISVCVGIASVISGYELLLFLIVITFFVFSLRRYQSISLILLLILIVGMVIGARDFAHLNVAGVYITELLMVIIFMSVFFRSIKNNNNLLLEYGIINSLILSIIIFGIIKVILSYSVYGIESIRDFALFYYSLFILIFYKVVNNPNRLKLVMKWYYVSSMLVPLTGILRIINNDFSYTSTGALRFLSSFSGLYMGISLLFLVLLNNEFRSKFLYIFSILWLFFGIILTSHRSVWIALFIAFVFHFIFSKPRFKINLVKYTLVFSIITIYSLALFMLVNYDLLNKYVIERIVELRNYQEDVNASDRLLAWEEVLIEFSNTPIIGVDFGNNLTYIGVHGELITRDAHNSFLSILYYGGLTGFVIMVGIILYSLTIFITKIRCYDGGDRLILIGVVSSIIYIIILSQFNVVLEGPYMAMFFWALIGIGFRFIELIKLN